MDDTSITEGDTATFTLTRGNNTANELLVGVSMDDPGGFLEGNYPSEAVAVPSSIMFAAGETIKEVAIAVPDDWRDIPDNAITFALAQEPDYDIVGSTSLTVQVADNDVAPQVSISFNHAEVEEGNDLTLEITRTGEDKNPLEIPITAGPVGDQQYHVFGMDAGMSLLHFTYRQPDDSFRGPDHHYAATLHPLRAEFWVPAGAATVNGAILDNDPYVVSVEALTPRVDEGNLLYYRISHNGHTGEPLQVKVNHAETGNTVYDSTLGNQTHTIPAGSSSITRAYLTHRNDGYDGDAEFTVELLADDAYEIDSGNSSASIIVRDKDPLPVLGFRDTQHRGRRRRRHRRNLGGFARGRAPSQDRNSRIQRPRLVLRRWLQYHREHGNTHLRPWGHQRRHHGGNPAELHRRIQGPLPRRPVKPGECCPPGRRGSTSSMKGSSRTTNRRSRWKPRRRPSTRAATSS